MRIWAASLAAVALVQPSLAQTTVDELEKALRGKQMEIRSFSSDPVVRYAWADGKLTVGQVDLHGLVVFTDDTVKLKGGRIVLDGHQATLVKNAGAALNVMGRFPMRLEVDLRGTDPLAVLPQLKEALFFPNPQVAVAALPDSVSKMLPFASTGQVTPTGSQFISFLRDGKWVELGQSPLFRQAQILKPGPTPDTGTRGGDSVTGAMILVVPDTGKVEEIWVARPVSPEFSKGVAESMRHTLFRPAEYDGKPVGVALVEEVKVESF